MGEILIYLNWQPKIFQNLEKASLFFIKTSTKQLKYLMGAKWFSSLLTSLIYWQFALKFIVFYLGF